MGFYSGWEWSHGVGLYGLFKVYQTTGDEQALEYALKWYKTRLPLGTSKNVNTVAPFLCAAYLHEQGQIKCEPYLDAWCEWVMHDMPRTQGNVSLRRRVQNHSPLGRGRSSAHDICQ